MEAVLAEVRKFAFDLVFDAAGGSTQRVDSTAKRFSMDEVEAARAEGLAAGRADAQAQGERALAAQLEACAQAMTRLQAGMEAEVAALRREAAQLALAMTRKAAGRALEDFGPSRIADALDAALETLGDTARLIVRLSPNTLERARPLLEQTAQAHGFSGAMVLRALPGAGPGDVTIEWSEGAISFETAALLARFEAALAEEDWGVSPANQEEPGR